MEASRIESTTVDGRRLAWRLVGSGPPLLLVNGYAATGADWDPGFVAALAEDREVICPDNCGVGESDPRPERLGIEAIAADLRTVLAAKGIERCPVVGWWMGGFAAQCLAETDPGAVGALGLLATDPGGAAAVAADPGDWAELTDRSGSPREQASRLISLLFPPPQAAEIDRRFGEVVAAARAGLSPAVLRAQEEAMEAWHRVERPPPAEPRPTLVLHGREDRVIPAANAEPLAARWGAAGAEIFPGCGHALMAQEPAAVASRLREFFAGV
ncbi:MAG TPA: alpha/beta fold hydrolase [Solirubrobacterales bacterium]|nr:alpha/beta fold hydrolase [Solirubrobacterales bacterium]